MGGDWFSGLSEVADISHHLASEAGFVVLAFLAIQDGYGGRGEPERVPELHGGNIQHMSGADADLAEMAEEDERRIAFGIEIDAVEAFFAVIAKAGEHGIDSIANCGDLSDCFRKNRLDVLAFVPVFRVEMQLIFRPEVGKKIPDYARLLI